MISTSLVAIAIQKRFTIDDILTLRPLVVSQEKTMKLFIKNQQQLYFLRLSIYILGNLYLLRSIWYVLGTHYIILNQQVKYTFCCIVFTFYFMYMVLIKIIICNIIVMSHILKKYLFILISCYLFFKVCS